MAQYDKQYKWALEASAKTGWDPDVIFAQWAWETAWFNSPNYRNNNNIAGQTWHSGLPESMKGTARPKNEGGYYIKYSNPVEGYVDFVNNNSRYNDVKNKKTEEAQIDEIAKNGWATDPNYASSLKSVLSTIKTKYGYNSEIQSTSKLNSPYKMSDSTKWVIGDTIGIDKNFLGRLAAFGEAHGKKVDVLSGNRTLEEQDILYQKYQNGTGNLAAEAGKSRHNYGLAVDVQGWARDVSEAKYKQFGMHKPVKSPQNEPWHIEPIETQGKTLAQIKELSANGISVGSTDSSLGVFGLTSVLKRFTNRNQVEYDDEEAGMFTMFKQIDEMATLQEFDLAHPFEFIIENSKAFATRTLLVLAGVVILIFGLLMVVNNSKEVVVEKTKEELEGVI